MSTQQSLIVCLIILALVGPTNAIVYYDSGGVYNLTTRTHGKFWIDNGSTVNIGDGVTLTLTREGTYSTSYLGAASTGSAYLNLSGSGRILFPQECAISLSDSAAADATVQRILTMSGTSYMNPATLYLGRRANCTLNITDNAVIEVRPDGTLYPPNIRIAESMYSGIACTATLNQSGNSIIKSLGSGMLFGTNNTAIYNMSGGELILGGTITGPGADDAFNFSGGTITMAGNRLPWASARSVWFHPTGPNAGAYTESYDSATGTTILKIPVKKVLDVNPISLKVYEDPAKGPQTDEFTVAISPDTGIKTGQVITVKVELEDPNDIDVTVNPTTLTFTKSDWNIPQPVTVTAIGNDAVCDGGFAETDMIALKVSQTGGEPNDVAGGSTRVPVTIIDYGCANIVISPTAVSVVEGGAGDSYTITMTGVPSGNVVVEVGADGEDPQDPNLMAPLTQVTVNGQSRVSLTFTAANWETPQTVTVAAVDDTVPEADPHTEAIMHRVTQSAGNQEYDGFVLPVVFAIISENDCGFGPFSAKDYNHDCRVDLEDFAAFASEWLTCSGVYLCN